MAIYLVTVKAAEPGIHLVRAKSRAAALAYVAGAIMKVAVPEAEELLDLGAKGVKVEDADAS
jgi:hypothetical protein